MNDGRNERAHMKRIILPIASLLLFFLVVSLVPASGPHPFSIGEKIHYKIYGAGLYLGNQEVELQSMETLDGAEVYRLWGRTTGTKIVNMIYHLDDKWMVFINRKSLLPMRMEKTIWEGKKKGFVVYEIDQEMQQVLVKNITENKEDRHEGENIIFDMFTLAYYYRHNHEQFDELFTFDFLETNGLLTAQFQNEGIVEITVPTISKHHKFQAFKMQQVGGIGIEIYVSADELRLPLKLVSNAILPKRKRLVLEMFLDQYMPGMDQDEEEIPWIYRHIGY
jgi:hypothetical protein